MCGYVSERVCVGGYVGVSGEGGYLAIHPSRPRPSHRPLESPRTTMIDGYRDGGTILR